jgi:cyanophycinase
MGSAQRTFLMLGSGEFEPWVEEAERAALARATGDGSVIVLPTASAAEGRDVFDRWGRMGLDHYRTLDIPARVLPVETRDDAMRDDLAAEIGRASMVFFSGGKPQHLASVVVGTSLWSAVLAAVDRGAVYAGCSAGAMAASQSRDQRAERGGVGTGWVFGLGLVPHVSFGVHWDRVRFVPGMRPFVMSRIPHDAWFVGIDERTATLGDGVRWEVFGTGTVTVRHARSTVTYRAGRSFQTLDAGGAR